MFIVVKGCEVVKENCIKVYRETLGKTEPKKDTMVEWLASGFPYKGIVYHKDSQFIYIRVLA